jgi:auxin-responsive protein IAA
MKVLFQKKIIFDSNSPPNYFFFASSDARVVPLPSAIGWPPVHTSRRNIVTAMHVTKTGGATVAADGPKGSTTTHAGGEKNAAAPTDSTVVATRPPANMFAKVHMDGCTIGRKINLRAHGSYESLSRVLTKITRNFFCRKYPGKTYFYLLSTFSKNTARKNLLLLVEYFLK